MQKAQEIWNSFFNAVQSEIKIRIDDENQHEQHEEERTAFESRYFFIASKLETLIEEKAVAT